MKDKFDNDPENIIARTVKILVRSTDTLSSKLPDDLLDKLYNKTNVREAIPDYEFTANLIYTVYSCYKTLKGVSDWDWDLSEKEFNNLVISWNILLGMEILRRQNKIKVQPFKILDFDTMDEIKLSFEINPETIQSLLN